MWDMEAEIGTQVPANRQDLIIHDKQKKICYIFDVAIPDNCNSVKKYKEKLTKYRDLETELQKYWGLKIRTKPIIIGSLATVCAALKEN